jgi:hypothetical protein
LDTRIVAADAWAELSEQGLVFAENFGLRSFNKPVAIIAPDKVIKPLCDRIELIFAISGFDGVNRFVQARNQFQGVNRQRLIIDSWSSIAWPMHLPEASDVPKFGCEITAFLDLLFIKGNVLSAWCDAHQTKAQSVCSIPCDQLEWIRARFAGKPAGSNCPAGAH